MSNNIIQFPSDFGAPAPVFGGKVENEAAAGIERGYSTIGIKGKVFTFKKGKEETRFEDQSTGASLPIDMVIIRTSSTKTKKFYKNGYEDGAGKAPDCWSSNAQTPDAGVPEPQCQTCVACPHNAFGSRISQSGGRGKACSDFKRLAVVPAHDIANSLFNGPMLLSVPATSLKALADYADMLEGRGFGTYQVVTRIRFDNSEAYPKLIFLPLRALSDAEGREVIELRNSPQVLRIVAEGTEVAHAAHDEVPFLDAKEVTKTASLSQQASAHIIKPAPAAPPAALAPAPAPAPTPVAATPVRATRAARPSIASAMQAAPTPAPVEEVKSDFEASLDSDLDSLLA